MACPYESCLVIGNLVRAFISSIRSLSTSSWVETDKMDLIFHFNVLILTAELSEMASSATSILAVGMGLGPQKEDSISMACGELARR